MSTQLDIKSALALGANATVPAIGPVILANVYPLENGVSKTDGTPYTRQNGMIKDASGQARLTVWNSPDIGAYEGRAIVLGSTVIRGRLNGVKISLGHDKEGKERLEVQASKSATILPDGAQPAPAPAPAPVVAPVQQVEPLPGSIAEKAAVVTTAAQIAQPAPKAELVRPDLNDVAALFRQCWLIAYGIVKVEGIETNLEVVQSAAATLFIGAQKMGLVDGAAKTYAVAAPVAAQPATGNVPF